MEQTLNKKSQVFRLCPRVKLWVVRHQNQFRWFTSYSAVLVVGLLTEVWTAWLVDNIFPNTAIFCDKHGNSKHHQNLHSCPDSVVSSQFSLVIALELHLHMQLAQVWIVNCCIKIKSSPPWLQLVDRTVCSGRGVFAFTWVRNMVLITV